MTKRDIQFSVDEIRDLSRAGYAICGRCSKGPIHIGDVFDRILYIEIRKTPEEYATAGSRTVENIHLRVERIKAYNHDFDTLDHGVTAEISVSGAGGHLLKVGQSIGCINETERDSLVGGE